MAKRPIFIPEPNGGLVEERTVEFEWFPGFAMVQKQRSIESLHFSSSAKAGVSQILEVSTKSLQPLGVQLSAFNLTIAITGHDHPVLLEAAFQGSKVFANQGPFTHLYSVQSGREVKRFMNELPEDELTCFQFDGNEWGLTPKTAFYDWIYITALRELAASADNFEDALLSYDAFTDIEFNPEKSMNCQARSCALYVALLKIGILGDATTDPESFIEVLKDHGYGVEPTQGRLL